MDITQTRAQTGSLPTSAFFEVGCVYELFLKNPKTRIRVTHTNIGFATLMTMCVSRPQKNTHKTLDTFLA